MPGDGYVTNRASSFGGGEPVPRCFSRCPSVPLVVLLLALAVLLPTCLFAQMGMGGAGPGPPLDRVDTMAFAKNGTLLAGAGENKIRIWTREPCKLIRTMTTEPWIRCIAAAPGARSWPLSAMIDLPSGTSKLAWCSRHYSPDGQLLAAAGWRYTLGIRADSVAELSLWNVSTGKRLWWVENSRQGAPEFSPDGLSIAGISRTNARSEIVIRDVATRRIRTLGGLDADPHGRCQIVYSPDGTVLAACTASDWCSWTPRRWPSGKRSGRSRRTPTNAARPRGELHLASASVLE